MTSAQFQSLCISERHEALDRMTPEQMIDFTECFTPSAGLPVGGESCWRTLALRLAIELRDERGRHEEVEAEPIEDLCPICDSQSYSNLWRHHRNSRNCARPHVVRPHHSSPRGHARRRRRSC